MILQRISLLFFSLILLSACSKLPDEDVINQNIDSILKGLNEKNASLVVEHLSSDFSGSHGNSHELDRQNARRLMAVYFLRHKNIDVVITHRETTVTSVSAITKGTALLVGRENILPEDGKLIQFTAQWLWEEDQWQLDRLDWQ